MSDEIVLFGVGDIGPNRDDPDSIFKNVEKTLKEGDVAFGQLEPVFSLRGTPLPQARLPMRCDPAGAEAIRNSGFDVISFATNHCMDWGREAFQDTVDALKAADIKVIGVGSNLAEAREPVFIDCRGVRIGFIGYNSILPQGYQAEANRPGCAPLRGHTYYEQIEHDQPGTPCRIQSYPHREDLKNMIEDVKMVRSQADIVVLSVHWGIHFIPAVIADYQRDYAYAAIDNGADIILGHHSHILKPVEVYKGKVIFYSLANFALEPPHKFAENEVLEGRSHDEIKSLNPKWKENPKKAMPPDSFKTVIAKCYINDKEISRVAFLPVQIDEDTYNPEILQQDDPRFSEVVAYMNEITADQKISTEYTVKNNEVEITINQREDVKL